VNLDPRFGLGPDLNQRRVEVVQGCAYNWLAVGRFFEESGAAGGDLLKFVHFEPRRL
jgi:hypothetical protein